MNKIITTFFAMLSLFSVSVAQQQPEKIVPDITYLPKTPPLVTLETDKQQYRGDDDLVLHITIENTDKKPIIFSVKEVVVFYKIQVTDSEGRQVPVLPSYGIRGFSSGEPWSLQPGQKRKAHVYLSRMFDLSMVGKYTVSVTNIQKPREMLVNSKPLTFEIVSNPTLGAWD